MFDFTGHPLASLNVFRYLKDGSKAALKVDYVPEVSVCCNVNETLELPQKVDVVYNNRSKNKQVAVKWNDNQVQEIDTSKAGTYQIEGELKDKTKLVANVEVKNINYATNPSFADSDLSV